MRFIGDAAARIAEDYLRILRFFRFHAAYGDGAARCRRTARLHRRAAPASSTLSRERVRMEMLKLLLARHAVPALAVMTEAGLLEMVLGGVPLLASLANTIKLEAALSLAPDPVRRLGALGVTVTEDAERLRDRLRLANSEYDQLASMADALVASHRAAGEQDARALLYRLGPDKYVDRVLLAWSRAPEGVADAHWRALATLPLALECAGVSAQGCRFHGSWRRQGAGARRRVARGRGGLDRSRFPARSGGAGADCRCCAGASDLTRCVRPIVGGGEGSLPGSTPIACARTTAIAGTQNLRRSGLEISIRRRGFGSDPMRRTWPSGSSTSNSYAQLKFSGGLRMCAPLAKNSA